jgi:hypothetical protein
MSYKEVAQQKKKHPFFRTLSFKDNLSKKIKITSQIFIVKGLNTVSPFGQLIILAVADHM